MKHKMRTRYKQECMKMKKRKTKKQKSEGDF